MRGTFGAGSPVDCSGKRYPDRVTTTLALADAVLVLRPDDDVAVATRDLQSGSRARRSVVRHPERSARPQARRPRGAAAGAPVHKYGQSIGRATRDIAAGDHVHIAQPRHGRRRARARVRHRARRPCRLPTGPGRTFDGYRRGDGRWRHPQLRRHRHLGELLGVDRPADRRPVPRPRARRVPARRRRHRADPRERLRPGPDAARARRSCGAPCAGTPTTPTSPGCWCSASAAR